MSGVLVVFAKRPEPGQVKTRLCPPLTPEQAAELYARMLDDVLHASARFADALGLAPVLAVHPPEAVDALAGRARAASPRYRTVAQRGRDLAARMQAVLDDETAAGRTPVLLRGSDSPALPEATLRAVCDALDESDLVACPDPDGGYHLIGLRRPAPGLFDHAMSTASVLEETLAHARGLGLRCRLMAGAYDVDVAQDLVRLAGEPPSAHEGLFPRTSELLRDLPASSTGRFGPTQTPRDSLAKVGDVT